MVDEQKKYIERLAVETLKKVHLARTAHLTELVFAGRFEQVAIPAPCKAELSVLVDLIESLILQSELSLAVKKDKKKGKK